jgi:hypothetical protein
MTINSPIPLEDNRHSHGDTRHVHPGGSIPHDHAALPAHRSRVALIVWASIGGVLLLARLVVPSIPIGGTSLGEANSVCSGAIGVFAKAFGGASVVHSCREVTTTMLVLNLAAYAGVALLIACGIVLLRRRQS